MGGRVEGRLERSSRTQTRVSNVAPGEYPDTAQAMVTLEFHTGNERRTLRRAKARRTRSNRDFRYYSNQVLHSQ